MPANSKVSVGWQIVASLITGVDVWAFYRIRKLRKFLLFIIAPRAVVYGAYFALLSIAIPESEIPPGATWVIYTDQIALVANVIGACIQGLAIYLVIIWSRQHNRQFDRPTAQQPGPPS